MPHGCPSEAAPSRWFRPRGSTARDGFEVMVRPGERGLARTPGCRSATLLPGQSVEIDTGDCEYLVLPLSGSAEVIVDGETGRSAGRADVFAGPTDLAYVPARYDVRGRQRRRRPGRLPEREGSPATYPFRRIGVEQVRDGAARRRASPPGRSGTSVRRVSSRRTRSSPARCSPRPATGRRTRRTSTTSTSLARERARGDLLLRAAAVGRRTGRCQGQRSDRLPAGLRHRGPADRRAGRGPQRRSWCWSRTAGTARRWRRPVTTCTT